MKPLPPIYHFLTPQPYEPIYLKMREYTLARNPKSPDLLWFLEHQSVFTQGQAGKAEHILNADHIPVVQSDRGGQVTYHGPGQLMVYVLCDLKRQNMGIKAFSDALQKSVINLLKKYDLDGHYLPNAPGVYIQNTKISSIGLRVRKGCTYHGISLNVKMDLSPFSQINPCGFKGLKMTQLSHFIKNINMQTVVTDLLPILIEQLPFLEKSLHEYS